MWRRLSILIILAAVSGLLWFADHEQPNTYLQKAFYTFAGLTIAYFVFRFSLEEIFSRRVREPIVRYSLRKGVSILYALSFLVILLTVWVENTQALLVSYGVIAAGAAFALQDLFKNFVGGLTILVTGIYRVGDRIEINSKCGDVIDVGLLFTTLMETNEWVSGDQATGRLSMLPNGHVLSGTVNNYTRDHNYIWDEISIPITYDSDWKQAVSIIAGIVDKETKEVADQADASISKLGEKYYLPRRALDPSLFLTLTDNWIAFNIRYVTEVRQRRALRSKLSETLLAEIQRSDGVTIASETLDVDIKRVPQAGS